MYYDEIDIIIVIIIIIICCCFFVLFVLAKKSFYRYALFLSLVNVTQAIGSFLWFTGKHKPVSGNAGIWYVCVCVRVCRCSLYKHVHVSSVVDYVCTCVCVCVCDCLLTSEQGK